MLIEEENKLKLTGRWRLTARHVKTGQIVTREQSQNFDPESLPAPWKFRGKQGELPDQIILEGPNLRVAIGKNLIGWMLMDASGYDTGLTYCAIGTGTTAPADGDVKLGTESKRVAITSKTIDPDTHEITFSTFFTAAQSTYSIQEAGIFGHSSASATPDSGVLFAHWLVEFDNSGGEWDVTIDYILTIG